jgi:hypothetical protein
MEVNLSSCVPTSNPKSVQSKWHAKVSLRIGDGTGVSQDRMGTFTFDETDNRDDVPLLLRQAQLALLNPATHYSEFVKLTYEQCKTTAKMQSFSQNTVVLDITGADVDVAFIDLPGIIQNTSNVISTALLGADFRLMTGT